MKFEKTPLKDCFILTPEVYKDQRGIFLESYHKKKFNEITGLDLEFSGTVIDAETDIELPS